jgi:hypothetical protein
VANLSDLYQTQGSMNEKNKNNFFKIKKQNIEMYQSVEYFWKLKCTFIWVQCKIKSVIK